MKNLQAFIDILILVVVIALCFHVKGRMDGMERQLKAVKDSVHVHPSQLSEEMQAAFNEHVDRQIAELE